MSITINNLEELLLLLPKEAGEPSGVAARLLTPAELSHVAGGTGWHSMNGGGTFNQQMGMGTYVQTGGNYDQGRFGNYAQSAGNYRQNMSLTEEPETVE